jgi:hypothetical protein
MFKWGYQFYSFFIIDDLLRFLKFVKWQAAFNVLFIQVFVGDPIRKFNAVGTVLSGGKLVSYPSRAL